METNKRNKKHAQKKDINIQLNWVFSRITGEMLDLRVKVVLSSDL